MGPGQGTRAALSSRSAFRTLSGTEQSISHVDFPRRFEFRLLFWVGKMFWSTPGILAGGLFLFPLGSGRFLTRFLPRFLTRPLPCSLPRVPTGVYVMRARMAPAWCCACVVLALCLRCASSLFGEPFSFPQRGTEVHALRRAILLEPLCPAPGLAAWLRQTL